MQNIGYTVGKYFFAIFLSLLGLIILAASKGQNEFFKLGGLAIILTGITSGLYVKGIIGRNVQIVLTLIFAISSGYLAWKNYDVIDDKLVYAKKKVLIQIHVTQRLKDIRKAQLAYLKENGRYASSFDSLNYFLKEGRLTLIRKLGSLPDSVASDEQARELGLISAMPAGWTDEQAIQSGLIIRDTVQVDVLSYVFNDGDRKTRKTTFYVDSLSYVPFASHKFEMKSDIIEVSGTRQPVFMAWDPNPFDVEYKVGSLTETSTSGNWTE